VSIASRLLSDQSSCFGQSICIDLFERHCLHTAFLSLTYHHPSTTTQPPRVEHQCTPVSTEADVSVYLRLVVESSPAPDKRQPPLLFLHVVNHNHTLSSNMPKNPPSRTCQTRRTTTPATRLPLKSKTWHAGFL
jgi:hypothetical protein